MTGSPRSLDNPINWSFAIGRLFGITIKLHVLFVLGALWIIVTSLEATKGAGLSLGLWLLEVLGPPAILFLMVLLHEFGHCFGARRMGGTADEVLLWPLGGLATVSPPHTPWAHLVTALAGPFVNVVICAVTSVSLIIWTGGKLGAVPWNPFQPYSPVDSTVPFSYGQHWLAYIFGLSYILLLFNLCLPVFPFDGGRVLQCWLWARKGYHDATHLAAGIGMVGAILIGVVGLVSKEFMLFGIAIFGYVTCYQQRVELKYQGFEGGFGQFSEIGPAGRGKAKRVSMWARWRIARAEARERRDRERLAALQQEVDRILEKVHQHGIGSLSESEKRILREATDRQRTDELRK